MANEQDRHIFMRCTQLNKAAFSPLPKGYTLRTCRPEELSLWYAFPFDTPEDAAAYRSFMEDYFRQYYEAQEAAFFEKCLFICDSTDTPLATGFLWQRDGHTTVEWVKTRIDAEGRGLGRALLSAILAEVPAGESVYLHTHAGCNRAVHLYTDFGFEILTAPEEIDGRPNEWRQALAYLQQVMPEAFYSKLRFGQYAE